MSVTKGEFDPIKRSYGERMSALAVSFPALQRAAAELIDPWIWERPGVLGTADVLDDWLASGAPSHGARCAGQFVLSLWNPNHPWKSGKFDLHEALKIWDDEHLHAFLNWARAPWYP